MAGRPVDQSPKPLEGPWEGESKIVIGIDIGTTQSGVACTFLQQGGKKTIHRVTSWPGQEAAKQNSKIPTVVWYDSDGKAVSFGAEAISNQAEMDAEDYGWELAKHFKLHLHPSDMQPKNKLKLDRLPSGVSLRQVYADFLGYLLQHTKSFFQDRILDGEQIWAQYQPKMEVVIAHPNGWGIWEQKFLRDAAVEAGFMNEASARTKIRFVTEAEASVHYCIHHTNLGDRLKAGMNFVVCDAGGSTVDTTVYSVMSARPVLELKEVRASACVQAGAIFVDAKAKKYLHGVFKNAKLSSEDIREYTKSGIEDFESFTKRSFRDASKDLQIKIAGRSINNPAINTRRGHMTLSGPTVESFFHHCTDEIVASVDQQVEGSDIKYVLLVGGFGDSPFLRREFKERYEARGSQVKLTNESGSKAVADGAVIWSIISSVFFRAPRSSFGATTSRLFRKGNPEHQGRISYISLDGRKKVKGGWSQVVTKGVPLDVEAICRKDFARKYDSATPDLSLFEVNLYSHSGENKPEWSSNKEGRLLPNFSRVCTIEADLKHLCGALEQGVGVHGVTFWYLEFNVCIRFGGTELQAFLEWEEDGVTHTGPMTIIPENVSSKSENSK